MRIASISLAATLALLVLAASACAPPPGISEADHRRVIKDLADCREGRDADRADHERSIKELEGAAAKQLLAERQALRQQLEKDLDELIKAGSLRIKVRRGLLVVQLDESLLFASGQAEVTAEGKKALAKVSRSLKGIKDRRFLIAGHTDNVPTRKDGPFKSNWELSTARSQSVVNIMRKNDVPAASLAVTGFGPTDPIGDNATDAGKKANRRTEMVILPDLSKLLSAKPTS